jgi:predicted ArsR family transcriptional regulator
MAGESLTKRFLESTRGQVVVLLRRGARTVEDLAEALGLTDNAIRSHLSNLERDGLVRQDGLRRAQGAGKPALLYEIRPDAEPLFSRAYAPILSAVLEELARELSPEQRAVLMERVGRRLATALAQPATGTLEARVHAAVELLNSLGGEARTEEKDGGFVIRGCGCPLSTVTAREPDACHAMQALLTEVVGRPVTECCDRGERPQCRFEVSSAA